MTASSTIPRHPFACHWVSPALVGERCEDGTVWTSRHGGNDPDVWPAGKCQQCDGSGHVVCQERGCDELAIMVWDGECYCADHRLSVNEILTELFEGA